LPRLILKDCTRIFNAPCKKRRCSYLSWRPSELNILLANIVIKFFSDFLPSRALIKAKYVPNYVRKKSENMASENVVAEVITEGEFQCCASLRDGFTFHLECISSADRSALSGTLKVTVFCCNLIKKSKLRGLSPGANYVDRTTGACLRSYCQLLRLVCATWSA
jgi:hypothetical protein